MCGRYAMFTGDEYDEIRRVIEKMNQNYTAAEYRIGEIYPTNTVPVLIQQEKPDLMTWGFPNFKKKGSIINARSETALEKKMFYQPLLHRRCVIPSTGFYEWSQNKPKTKYLFQIPQQHVLYMAGIYHEYQGKNRFVILTTQANDSIAEIHNRMPLILLPDKLTRWIEDTDFALSYLHAIPPELEKIPVK